MSMFICFGADAFAERTRRELLATGEKVRKRTDETRGQLTAQEEQIARLAADGQTNQEIGAQLFLSPRTVEWHLHKVFTKLGVGSRMQLRDKLPDAARDCRTGLATRTADQASDQGLHGRDGAARRASCGHTSSGPATREE